MLSILIISRDSSLETSRFSRAICSLHHPGLAFWLNPRTALVSNQLMQIGRGGRGCSIKSSHGLAHRPTLNCIPDPFPARRILNSDRACLGGQSSEEGLQLHQRTNSLRIPQPRGIRSELESPGLGKWRERVRQPSPGPIAKSQQELHSEKKKTPPALPGRLLLRGNPSCHSDSSLTYNRRQPFTDPSPQFSLAMAMTAAEQ
ncbi:hypothetical protein B0T14DRAFT_54305 [Immersiella caudata]|uniref:Uncharacterized protein n=1 Tax=Immersiella caudata TaxID=314043 RepID=A0AA39XHD6_9PEZI|nr:hypothetical protein B0T14DRAFT_54305 [Immersiella caudata]